MEKQHAEFVDRNRSNLIQRVTVVMAIADALRAVKLIHEETYSNIFVASTNMDKMRVLLGALNTNKAKSAFYNSLKDNDPFLFEDLKPEEIEQGMEGASAQTSSEVLETESHPQNTTTVQMEAVQQRTEGRQVTWWNRDRSRTRHKTKIEELRRETGKQKVGNLWFYKVEKYMIGSGGSGTQVYIGVSEDGIEVAIKIITKNPKNIKDFENELKLLQELESPYIVRYVTCAADKDFYYLANHLCEYDLVDYMEYLRQPEQKDRKETSLRRIVEEMLLGLQVLHRAGVVHRDIKPRNVLIDKEERARLADFGLSRKLEEGETTMYTDRAGTQGWEATEIVNQTEKGGYKASSDIQVAGMLTYYILSDGKHPFGDGIHCVVNISEGKYSLEDIKDIAAKDLIEWMINKEPDKRPTIDRVLNHPYFWDDKRKEEALRKVGDRPEVQCYTDISKVSKNWKAEEGLKGTEAVERAFDRKDKKGQKRKTKVLGILGDNEQVKNENFPEKFLKLCDYAESYSKDKTFIKWKSELSDDWSDIDKTCPEDLIGLLRTYRNKLSHVWTFDEQMFDRFPDFYISLHRLATDMGWDCIWS
ncbi:sensor for unfolded proteins in the ER ire1-like isoform X2 [Cyprinus carpio]|uniref:Sensor for unfolded proteins in the ER ire1-like isoform X2 n=1 Tax=Cyprinus carpio TaxID=7962 RepID=A0A9Q9ZVP0_CYPCA|nr:sensor for unfolded proteins in the ER ire1-like isoform X2 [Cyprinus carpio]XP_042575589.1 sensor for unfolded proteins in the ER ire1-like isoform X2 [Cyprinus carpio]